MDTAIYHTFYWSMKIMAPAWASDLSSRIAPNQEIMDDCGTHSFSGVGFVEEISTRQVRSEPASLSVKVKFLPKVE